MTGVKMRLVDNDIPGPFLYDSDAYNDDLPELSREGDAGYPKMMSVGLDPRLIGQAGRTSTLREFIERALAKGNVWFARRIDIARWWLDHHQEFAR